MESGDLQSLNDPKVIPKEHKIDYIRPNIFIQRCLLNKSRRNQSHSCQWIQASSKEHFMILIETYQGHTKIPIYLIQMPYFHFHHAISFSDPKLSRQLHKLCGTWDVFFFKISIDRNFQMCSHQKLSSNIYDIKRQNNTLQILRLSFGSSKIHWIIPSPWAFTLWDSNDIAAKNLQLLLFSDGQPVPQAMASCLLRSWKGWKCWARIKTEK